jgi:hypothetical protein
MLPSPPKAISCVDPEGAQLEESRETGVVPIMLGRYRRAISKFLISGLVIVMAGVVLFVLAGEAFLRVTKRDLALVEGGDAFRLQRFQRSLRHAFTLDPDIGFRPRFDGGFYNEYGTRTNRYSLEKRAGITRLLFIGDSVTHRGNLVKALRALYGNEAFEYWNAGVESFNTKQEVEFYKRFNAKIRPDHVILTFHPNDFVATPVAFWDNDNRLVLCSFKKSARRVSPWLFKRSYLYRFLLGLSVSRTSQVGIADEVRASLIDLGNTLQQDEISLTVLVLPFLRAYEEWPQWEVRKRAVILGILTELGIRRFDLLEVLREAIAEGVGIYEHPGDILHPSQALCDRFASHLFKAHVLEESREIGVRPRNQRCGTKP